MRRWIKRPPAAAASALLLVGAAWSMAPSAVALASPRPATSIALDHRQHTVRINGVDVSSYALTALAKALGRPTRIVVAQSKTRYERFGMRGGRSISRRVTVYTTHHVYDPLGIVLSSRASRWSRGQRPPEVMHLVVRRKPQFSHGLRFPAPKRLFRGRLTINGRRVDLDRRLVPKGVTYRTEKFTRYGARFAPTSRAMVIDSIYAHDQRPAVRIFFDSAAEQRAATIRIR